MRKYIVGTYLAKRETEKCATQLYHSETGRCYRDPIESKQDIGLQHCLSTQLTIYIRIVPSLFVSAAAAAAAGSIFVGD